MEYLKTFFRRIIEGQRDYSLLMPQTIGISVKKCLTAQSVFNYYLENPPSGEFSKPTRHFYMLTNQRTKIRI